MKPKISVAILDDHAAIIEGYLARLRDQDMIDVAGTASDGEEMEQILADHAVDVLLLDLSVPINRHNRNIYPALVAIPRLTQTYPKLKVLVISMYGQVALIQAVMEAGAHGYIMKNDRAYLNDLPAIIETVAHGGSYFSQEAFEALFRASGSSSLLSARQLQALSLCAAYPDLPTHRLAEQMKVAPSTLRNLLSSAYTALKVHTRSAAVTRAHQLGYLQVSAPGADMHSLAGDNMPTGETYGNSETSSTGAEAVA